MMGLCSLEDVDTTTCDGGDMVIDGRSVNMDMHVLIVCILGGYE